MDKLLKEPLHHPVQYTIQHAIHRAIILHNAYFTGCLLHIVYYALLLIFSVKGCGLDYHKRCAYKIPNNCSREKSRRLSMMNSNASSAQYSTLPRSLSITSDMSTDVCQLFAVNDFNNSEIYYCSKMCFFCVLNLL